MLSRERSSDERAVLRTWGDIIRRYRLWRRLSRRELAQRAGISPVFLGEIERGDKDLSLHSLCLLAAALGVSVGELYLRVGAQMQDIGEAAEGGAQTSLPLVLREGDNGYLEPLPPPNDETAFDLYKIVRRLTTSQQVSLLVLARTMAPSDGGKS